MANLSLLKGILLLLLMFTSAFSSCEQPTKPPPDEKEPYFQPGEYGGDPLEGTEHLYNMQLSPDGSKIALIRSRTPGKPFEPRDQLWIVNADGTNPELIGYNFGGADWSPDGNKLAITFFPGAPYTYVFTVNLDSMKATQWTGFQNSFFSKRTASKPIWFPDNERLLISVWGKAYKQPYERGLYILNSADGSVQGPLVEVVSGGDLGDGADFVIGKKYLTRGEALNGNFIRYDFSSQNWNWVTNFSQDSLDWVEFPFPNPNGSELVLAQHLNNAWQLFTMDSHGNNVKQITKLGGSEVGWSKDGTKVYFNRDTHKAPGARYIPYYYELASEEIQPIWTSLPDSVPKFPPLNTQNPIDFRAIIQSNTTSNN